MTGFVSISSDLDHVERVKALQSVAQQIAIERAHHMRVFANRDRIWLEPNDEQLIRAVADYSVRLRYQGLDNDAQRQLARLASGTLPIEILNGFDAVITKRSVRKLALYAAHDNTLMALLSHLGFRDWPVPQFGAHCIFELHYDDDGNENKDDDAKDDETSGRWSIRFAYNDQIDRLHTMQYVQLPLRDDILCWSETASGRVPYRDWNLSLRQHRDTILSDQNWAQCSQI